MIPFKVMIVNSNPKSPNAVRLGNGRGGRVISRNQYYVYGATPPFPFEYQLWIVNDLQRRAASCEPTKRRFINVSSQNDDETFFCQACDKKHCEHIRAVLVFLDKKRKGEKSIEAHAAKAKEFISDLQMRFAYRSTHEQHLQHLRVYANRFKVDFIELAREYEKYL